MIMFLFQILQIIEQWSLRSDQFYGSTESNSIIFLLDRTFSQRISFQSELFQDDLYPDMASAEYAITANEWFNGKNANPKLVNTFDCSSCLSRRFFFHLEIDRSSRTSIDSKICWNTAVDSKSRTKTQFRFKTRSINASSRYNGTDSCTRTRTCTYFGSFVFRQKRREKKTIFFSRFSFQNGTTTSKSSNSAESNKQIEHLKSEVASLRDLVADLDRRLKLVENEKQPSAETVDIRDEVDNDLQF